ncbi:MAG: hypothetical protein ACI8S6_002635 [Myxococcota bacterium]|jgi:hypothetical protein
MLMLFFSLIAAAAACPDPSRLADVARESMFNSETSDELEDALQSITEARDALLCSEQPVSADTLAAIHQTGGVILMQLSRSEEADTWLKDAVRLTPHIPFDSTLTTQVTTIEQFDAAVEAVSGSATVLASAPAGAVIDGWPIAPGSTRSVSAGQHFVQNEQGGSLRSEWVDLQQDAAVGSEVEVSSEERQGRPWLAVGGVALIGGGIALGQLGSSYQRATGWYEPYPSEQATFKTYEKKANLYTLAGVALVGVGTASLVGATFVGDTPGVFITGRW